MRAELLTQEKTHAPSFCLRETPLGPVAILWSVCGGEPKICRILLSGPRISAGDAVNPVFAASSCPKVDRILDQIEAFLNGEDIRFSLDAFRLDLCSAFQMSVLLADRAIPRGRVSSYKLIAEHLDKPKGARAVGAALADNPFPLVIPCHRVIRSDGGLGGFQYGLKMKKRLLEMEGVAFLNDDHAATREFFYQDQGG